jgi:hypothetical protein
MHPARAIAGQWREKPAQNNAVCDGFRNALEANLPRAGSF